jgi:2-keto-3-deoxy-L-rhamnonate aldolase RhmA
MTTHYEANLACAAILETVEEQIKLLGIPAHLGVDFLIETGLALAVALGQPETPESVCYQSFIQTVLEQIEWRSNGKVKTLIVREETPAPASQKSYDA